MRAAAGWLPTVTQRHALQSDSLESGPLTDRDRTLGMAQSQGLSLGQASPWPARGAVSQARVEGERHTRGRSSQPGCRSRQTGETQLAQGNKRCRLLWKGPIVTCQAASPAAHSAAPSARPFGRGLMGCAQQTQSRCHQGTRQGGAAAHSARLAGWLAARVARQPARRARGEGDERADEVPG